MREISYQERWKELLTPEIVPLLTKIHKFKGEQALFIEVHSDELEQLITLLLLYRSGYIVGKYISIEKLIEISKDTYYEVLYESSCLWHEQKNDYVPFVRYMLGVIVNAYREFSSRVKLMITSDLSKPERVREVIKDTLGTITKAEIAKKCPDISQITIQRALAELLARGEITKIGGGRYTKYTWNWSKGDYQWLVINYGLRFICEANN